MNAYTINLRNLREDHDLTQQQVAEYLGTSQTMVARYEREASELPLRHFIRLCQLYKVSSDEVLGLWRKNEIRSGLNSVRFLPRKCRRVLQCRKERAAKPQRGDVGIAPYAENKRPGQQVGGQKTEGQAVRLSLSVL